MSDAYYYLLTGFDNHFGATVITLRIELLSHSGHMLRQHNLTWICSGRYSSVTYCAHGTLTKRRISDHLHALGRQIQVRW
jgi:hypothetical protein